MDSYVASFRAGLQYLDTHANIIKVYMYQIYVVFQLIPSFNYFHYQHLFELLCKEPFKNTSVNEIFIKRPQTSYSQETFTLQGQADRDFLFWKTLKG